MPNDLDPLSWKLQTSRYCCQRKRSLQFCFLTPFCWRARTKQTDG